MKPIPSTAEILMHKTLDHPVDEQWVAWAYDMLCAGYDTETLIELAGENPPYNQFELSRLSDRVFEALNLNWNDRDKIFTAYISYLITHYTDGETTLLGVLKPLERLYIETDYENIFHDFALLHWAHEDLEYDDNAPHWDGATRENIDDITKAHFKEWVEKYSGKL